MNPGNLLTRTKNWLQTHEINVRKRLGQHFLIDEQVLDRLLTFAVLSDKDVVLEIGAGTGTLTHRLANRAKRVYAIEKDPRIYYALAEEFETENRVSLILGDAVKLRWPASDKLVANLPYNISSPVIFKFLESSMPLAVLTLQKEFAERLVAKEGNKKYGRLTVMVAYTAKVELLESLAPNQFFPPPAISSAIVRLTRHSEAPFPVVNYPFFAALVKAVFNQRRKKLHTSLKTFLVRRNIPSAVISKILSQVSYVDSRPEELAPNELAELANIIHEEIAT